MENMTFTGSTTTHGQKATGGFNSNFALYVGIGVGAGVLICILILMFILMHRSGRIQLRRKSVRKLFLRGFSTVSQRGVLDSTGEFEMVNTSVTVSVSSEDGQVAKESHRTSANDRKTTPKKPGRRRKSSSSNKYENVTLDPQAGFVVRKSLSMGSEIPFIDNTGTLDPKLTAEVKEDELDDVFQ